MHQGSGVQDEEGREGREEQGREVGRGGQSGRRPQGWCPSPTSPELGGCCWFPVAVSRVACLCPCSFLPIPHPNPLLDLNQNSWGNCAERSRNLRCCSREGLRTMDSGRRPSWPLPTAIMCLWGHPPPAGPGRVVTQPGAAPPEPQGLVFHCTFQDPELGQPLKHAGLGVGWVAGSAECTRGFCQERS